MPPPSRPITAGLRLTDAAASNMRSAVVATSPQQGTILVWFVPSSIANANRAICGKGGGASQSFLLQRETVDGSKIELAATRTTTAQSSKSTTGVFTVGQAVCIAGQFDIAGGNPNVYAGYLDAPMVDVTGTQQNGTGTSTTSGGDYRLGATGANAAGGVYFAFAFSLYRLTLDEMRAWQRNPSANLRGCDVFWRPGMQGGTLCYDEANGWRGTATSSVVAADPLPLTRPKPPRSLPPYANRLSA